MNDTSELRKAAEAARESSKSQQLPWEIEKWLITIKAHCTCIADPGEGEDIPGLAHLIVLDVDTELRPVLSTLTARVTALEGENKTLREALTPSADTKAEYIGEFSFDHEIYDLEKDCPISTRIMVPWTTIKEIMAAILRRAAAARGKE